MKTETDLGDCCICHGGENVRSIVMHNLRAPVAGTGWGCVVCDLPSDGAISVVCDDCVSKRVVEIMEVCYGYAKNNKRVSVAGLEPFEHDMRFHQEEWREQNPPAPSN